MLAKHTQQLKGSAQFGVSKSYQFK